MEHGNVTATQAAERERQLSAQEVPNGRTPSVHRETEGFGYLTLEKQAELQAIAIAKAAEAEVQSAYIMALKRPRNEEDARVAINRVCQNRGFAKKAKYRKPVGETHIVGPSIRMAEEIGRHWGNVLIQQNTIYEDTSKRVGRVVVKDLQTNIGYSKEFVIEKTVERKKAEGREVLSERTNSYKQRIFIVRATEDELLNKEAAIASKVIRNNLLRLIPEHILEEALAVVDGTLRQGVTEDPQAAKRQLLDQFGTLGIKASDIEIYLKHPIAQLTAQEMVELQDIVNSIKDGQAKWPDFLHKEDRAEPAKGNLDAFKAGDPETHTSVEEPIGPMDDPEALRQSIEEGERFLQKSERGQNKILELRATCKVKNPKTDPLHIQKFYEQQLRKAKAEFSKNK